MWPAMGAVMDEGAELLALLGPDGVARLLSVLGESARHTAARPGDLEETGVRMQAGRVVEVVEPERRWRVLARR
jgi:hypothetical protein